MNSQAVDAEGTSAIGSSGADRGPFSLASERLALYGIYLLVFYASVRAAFATLSKPFWYDEMFTWAMAHQPDFATLSNALLHGSDSMPPVYEWVEHVVAALPHPEIGMRLPSIAGFACVLICLFVFVRRRSSAVYGLIAASMALVTSLYLPFAIEARPYSMLSACVAIALVAYQRAPSAGWVVLMAAALAFGQSLHYYALFALIPFGAAELFFSWQSRNVRWRVWIALLIGAAPFAVLWPFLAHFKALYGDTFWARPTISTLYDVYGVFLQVSSFWGLSIAMVCALAVLGALPSSQLRLSLAVRAALAAAREDRYFHERILVFSLLAMPLVLFVACLVTHGAFASRYAIYAAMGIPLAIGLALPHYSRSTAISFVILLAGAIGLQEARFWFSPLHSLAHMPSPTAAIEKLLGEAGHADLPVVVASSHDYLTFAHYGEPALVARMVFVADAPAALQYAGTDSDDRTLPLLAKYFPLQVDDFAHFRSAHPEYLLYSTLGDAQGSGPDWWPERLTHDGFGVRVLAVGGGAFVYLVTPGDSGGR